jgi:hypothetical protein
MRHLIIIILTFLFLQNALAAAPQTTDDRGFDPTGVWMGLHGPLTLMRAGDTLSFSYSAVFGSTAHICDGIGVAGFIGNGKWEYVDEQGSVIFTTLNSEVTMSPGQGVASFCGANWPGDCFGKDGWKPAYRCTVTVPKAYFYAVGRLPSERRQGYVVKGNQVEALGLVNEGSPAWLLTRYIGRNQTTAGLLERDALECHYE